MLFISIPLPVLIGVVVIILVAVAAFFIIKKIDNKNKEYFKQIVFNLMKEKMEDVVYEEKNQNYDVSFKFNNTNFFIKVYLF